MGWFSLRLINFSALMGTWGYAYLAGFSLPTQRAFLMLFVVVSVFSLKWQGSKGDLLLLVLVAVLIWDPLAVLSVSLWLSFSAVAIILGLFWAFPRRNISQLKSSSGGIKGHFFRYIKLLFFLQIGLTLLMIPVQLVSFSGLSLVGVLINLLATPLFSLAIIPLVLMATFITLFYPPLAHAIFLFCDQLLTYFFSLSLFLSRYYQCFSTLELHLLLTLFILLMLLFFINFQSVAQRRISYLFSFLILLLLSLPLASKKDEWFVEVIDVGQGLSVLVRSGNSALLYDTGARYPSGFNMADSEITPYLVSLGISKLEHLVISHSDIDHAGGAERINDEFSIVARWAGEPLHSDAHFQPCQQGQFWTLDKLQIEVLSPEYVTTNNNNNSCVLRISDGTTSFLLTGDIEKNRRKY